ncbi:MAG: serine/threonine protein kinase [Candidatus Saccharimonas sp.]|nr:serine/threonine protein kinase [Planctomycetaceae bacterium]
MPALRNADQDQLHKLLLGQLPSAEVERLATEYADDSRLAELAESLAGQDDALLHLLHNHETAVVDPDGERLVERLVQRLKPALPVQPRDDTAAMNRADVTTEPSLLTAMGQPQKLPERLEYYRPIKVLGQGGMGTVYLAEDTRLGREVAIKTLRPELAANPQAKERFLREARSAAKLEHDHIIPIYSVGEAADGTPFLAMPLLKGEPLDALIRRTTGPLPVALVVRLAREVASGLAAAHARGLIHRDIKPANIWLEAPTGRVKILDFGLAKAADAGSEADPETHLTSSGAIVGTPSYMAPEQASGHSVDGRADLFSLGCVLYELLAGKRAFSGPNTMSILMSLANHMPPAPDTLSPQCPAALSRLVMQLLAKVPAHRPASAEAVIHALDELDVAPDKTSVLVSRAASAPGLPPNSAAVRWLTPNLVRHAFCA